MGNSLLRALAIWACQNKVRANARVRPLSFPMADAGNSLKRKEGSSHVVGDPTFVLKLSWSSKQSSSSLDEFQLFQPDQAREKLAFTPILRRANLTAGRSLFRGQRLYGVLWGRRLGERHTEQSAGGQSSDRDPGFVDRLNERGLFGIARSKITEAFLIDSPPHDVERVGPCMLAAHLHGADAARSSKYARHRAASEQRRGDDNRLGQLVEAKGQRAHFDRDEQHDAARP